MSGLLALLLDSLFSQSSIVNDKLTCCNITYNSDIFWNNTWLSAQWRALCTKVTEVNLSVFVYRLFHEDFSPIIGTNFRHVFAVLIMAFCGLFGVDTDLGYNGKAEPVTVIPWPLVG